jgi:hypothetical protein
MPATVTVGLDRDGRSCRVGGCSFRPSSGNSECGRGIFGSTQIEVRGVKTYFDHERHHVQSHPEASR